MAIFVSSRRAALVGALLASAALGLPFVARAATTASVPRAPSVSTGTSPLVSTTSATLKGAVNPHGVETVYAFQFGTTAGYGAQTALAALSAATPEAKVSQTITGLQPGTTYHYRLVATNGDGTSNGNDVAFTTKKIPLTLTIAQTPDPAVFGDPLSVTGVLSGTGAGDHAVVLQADRFPYLGGFADTGQPGLTDANGVVSFSLPHVTETTELRLATLDTPPIKSPVVVARVAVRVSLSLGSAGRPGFVRMYGTVTPAEPGARVGFQLMRPGLRPLTVAGALTVPATARASRFSRVVHIRRGGLYRAVVQVLNGRQVSGHSRPLRIR